MRMLGVLPYNDVLKLPYQTAYYYILPLNLKRVSSFTFSIVSISVGYKRRYAALWLKLSVTRKLVV
jgi:hypothetical protein